MNPLVLFLDMLAVAGGLVVNGVVLGGLSLTGLYLLGLLKEAQHPTGQKSE